jgi:hypothetical protein
MYGSNEDNKIVWSAGYAKETAFLQNVFNF